MTESVRHGEFSPASSGTAFEPGPQSPVDQWDGDHARTDSSTSGSGDSRGHEPGDEVGIDPAELPDEDLFREMASLHRTRLHTLRHGPDAALATHLRRTAELETEYLTRYPGREVDPSRLTQGD
ncbi:MAG TPA: DUF6158 family protein [Catenuloplanes sp.]|jgi:hypothetical protein